MATRVLVTVREHERVTSIGCQCGGDEALARSVDREQTALGVRVGPCFGMLFDR